MFPSEPPVFGPTQPRLIDRVIGLLTLQSQPLPACDPGGHRGPRRKIQDWQIQAGMIIHMLLPQGALAQCIWQHLHLRVSDAALSLRRQQMKLQPFLTILAHALRPLAVVAEHPECFFKGLRLVGHDGTQMSVSNTAAVLAEMTKVKTRRGLAAFAKVGLGVLVELGTHNPLAAAIGLSGESESVLFSQALKQLPQGCLLILDRWYGNAPVLEEVRTRCASSQSEYLLRVRHKLAVKVLERHPDGSATVEVALRDKQKPRVVLKRLKVREVRASLQRRLDGSRVEVRLWTSLSVEQASAGEVVELYARRWEQEVFYKELKMGLRNGDLLLSQTPRTAAQEVAALLMAASLVAEERLACAQQSEEPEVRAAGVMRISFGLCLQMTTALWIVLAAGADLLDAATQAELVRRTRQQIAEMALPKRRQRTCARKVRQPVCKWPRMLQPTSITSAPSITLVPIT